LIDNFTIGAAPIRVCSHLFVEVNKIVECNLQDSFIYHSKWTFNVQQTLDIFSLHHCIFMVGCKAV